MKNSFNDLFLVNPNEFTKTPKYPWIYLKNKNRWVCADLSIYNPEDQESLKRLLVAEKTKHELK